MSDDICEIVCFYFVEEFKSGFSEDVAAKTMQST